MNMNLGLKFSSAPLICRLSRPPVSLHCALSWNDADYWSCPLFNRKCYLLRDKGPRRLCSSRQRPLRHFLQKYSALESLNNAFIRFCKPLHLATSSGLISLCPFFFGVSSIRKGLYVIACIHNQVELLLWYRLRAMP